MRPNSVSTGTDRCPLNPFTPPSSGLGLPLGKVNPKKIVIKKPSGILMSPDQGPKASSKLPKPIIKVRPAKVMA